MNHTDVFLGIAMLQFVYIGYQFILFRRKEFVYYLLYTFCITFDIFCKTYPGVCGQLFTTVTEPFTAGRGLLLVAFAMYYRFGRHFTETPVFNPVLNRQLYLVESFLITYGAIDITLMALGIPFDFIEPVGKTVYILIMPFSVYVIAVLLFQRRRLTNILIIGSSFLFVFGVAGFIDLHFITKHTLPEPHYQAYLEAGVIVELLFLNFGLAYKTRRLQRENIRLAIMQERELNRHRMLISSDLHDEVGATLSGIALYSHLATQQAQKSDKSALGNSLEIIARSATEMVSKLNDIIWSVDPSHDSIDEVFRHLQDYMAKMSQAKNINTDTKICPKIRSMLFPMPDRKNIWLLFKEAINNAVKYSNASKIVLEASGEGGEVHIFVSDNGKGFEMSRHGHGLRNMKERAKKINGRLQIESQQGKGTQVGLFYKIPQGLVAPGE